MVEIVLEIVLEIMDIVDIVNCIREGQVLFIYLIEWGFTHALDALDVASNSLINCSRG